MEDPHGIAAAANAGNDHVRQPPEGLQVLGSGLQAHHRLEIAYHGGVGVGPDDRPDHVEAGVHVGDPVTHRLVDGVLQCPRAGFTGDDLGAQQLASGIR